MMRHELRKRKVYAVIKNLHADAGIENEDFENAVFEIVNFLDETREEELPTLETVTDTSNTLGEEGSTLISQLPLS